MHLSLSFVAECRITYICMPLSTHFPLYLFVKLNVDILSLCLKHMYINSSILRVKTIRKSILFMIMGYIYVQVKNNINLILCVITFIEYIRLYRASITNIHALALQNVAAHA